MNYQKNKLKRLIQISLIASFAVVVSFLFLPLTQARGGSYNFQVQNGPNTSSTIMIDLSNYNGLQIDNMFYQVKLIQINGNTFTYMWNYGGENINLDWHGPFNVEKGQIAYLENNLGFLFRLEDPGYGVGNTWAIIINWNSGSQCGNMMCESGEDINNCRIDCAPPCGNGVCSPEFGENQSTCAFDCGAVCGNMMCESGEDINNCRIDCAPPCGNGVCSPEFGENQTTCAFDCGGAVCGNNQCEQGENPNICIIDCPSNQCGNHACENGEDPNSCPQDCGMGGIQCGNGMCDNGEPDSCPQDCAPQCNLNGMCDPNENSQSCPQDCGMSGGTVCGNNQCESGENSMNCPNDCGMSGIGFNVQEQNGPNTISTIVIIGMDNYNGPQSNMNYQVKLIQINENIFTYMWNYGGEDNWHGPFNVEKGQPTYLENNLGFFFNMTDPGYSVGNTWMIIINWNGGSQCGNNQCEPGEDQNNCPHDCGMGGGTVCGNGICENGENPMNCPDCQQQSQCNYNFACEQGENSGNCPSDCGVQCGSIITTNTTLNSNLSCDTTALYIGADNVVLDCSGHTITHTGIGSGVEIGNHHYYITIKNCNIIGNASIPQNWDNSYQVKLTQINGTTFTYMWNYGREDNWYGPFNVEKGQTAYLENLGFFFNSALEYYAGNTWMINVGTNGGSYQFQEQNGPNTISTIMINPSNYNGPQNVSYNIGISVWSESDNNKIINNTLSYNNEGMQIFDRSNNTIIANNIVNSNYDGIVLDDGINNTVTNNTISNNTNEGIVFHHSQGDLIYNNFFSNIINTQFALPVYQNVWNTLLVEGMNIVGGTYLGGNFWGNPIGTGFSQTCSDSNADGICDSAYTLATNNIDYFPLTYLACTDADGDGICDNLDNCPSVYNPNQIILDSISPAEMINPLQISLVPGGAFIGDAPLRYNGVDYNNILSIHNNVTTQSSFWAGLSDPGVSEPDSLNNNFALDSSKPVYAHLVKIVGGIINGSYTVYSQTTAADAAHRLDMIKDDLGYSSYSIDLSVVVFTIGQPDSDGDGIGDVCDICPGDATDTCNPLADESGTVGFEGGTIVTGNGNAEVVIPQGALDEDTTITLVSNESTYAVSMNQGEGFILSSYGFYPSGQTFTTPITITLAYEQGNMSECGQSGSQEDKLDIYYNDPVSGWTPQGATQDCVNNKLSLQTTHFSEYALIVPVDDDLDGYPLSWEGTVDCNDNNPNIYPGATEICNNIDDNCNGIVDEGVQTTFYQDLDGDTFGNALITTQACSVPEGYVSNFKDLCPLESSIGFDANSDGCIDTIAGLQQIINTLPADVLSYEIKNSLTSKVDNALKSVNKENDEAAINMLGAFVNQVEAQRGKKISGEAADMLIAYAKNVIAQIKVGQTF